MDGPGARRWRCDAAILTGDTSLDDVTRSWPRAAEILHPYHTLPLCHTLTTRWTNCTPRQAAAFQSHNISTFNPSYVRCHCIVSVCMRNFLCLLSKSSLILTWYFRNAAASVLLSSMLYPPKIWSLPKDYQLTIKIHHQWGQF